MGVIIFPLFFLKKIMIPIGSTSFLFGFVANYKPVECGCILDGVGFHFSTWGDELDRDEG